MLYIGEIESVKEVAVIPFIEQTWFLWWIFATLAILRWLHVISAHSAQEAPEVSAPTEAEAPVGLGRGPSRNRKTPRFGSEHAY
jgi:hypothetical protein